MEGEPPAAVTSPVIGEGDPRLGADAHMGEARPRPVASCTGVAPSLALIRLLGVHWGEPRTVLVKGGGGEAGVASGEAGRGTMLDTEARLKRSCQGNGRCDGCIIHAM